MKTTGRGLLWIFLLVIGNLYEQGCQGATYYPRLSFAIRNTGFHRDILYSLSFPKPIDCDVIIVQTLHQGTYVSNDQLNDLKKLGLIKSYVPSYINVELPMEKSPPFTVYLFGKGVGSLNIKLPIHLRYQSPSLHKSFQSVPVYEPAMYLSYEKEFYIRKTNDTFRLPCPNANDIHNVYDLPNAESCDWFDVDYISNQEGPVTIPVPVGNQSLSIPVALLTLLVAWAAAAYLIFAVIKQRNRIQKKVS